MVDWSDLPKDLLNLIAVRLYSLVELKRFRSICGSWRSSVPGNNNPFPSRPLIDFNPSPKRFSITGIHEGQYLSRSAFFRVTLSSSSSQGWLIKSDADINSGKFHLVDPLSRHTLQHCRESVDLLEFTISEIQEAYEVQDWCTGKATTRRFKRVVLVKDEEGDDRIVGIKWDDGMIKYWKGRSWRFTNFFHQFSDIIVHKGLTYVLDSKGSIWWLDSSLSIVRYGPSLGENITNGCCGDRSLVECCGELYIVDRLLEENTRKRKADSMNASVSVWNVKTVGFKVYKFDDEKLGEMVEVKSLGDNAFVMATDTCFSVLASEFYGCLKNTIYFTEKNEIKVFKLDNGMITSMSEVSQNCFQMFVPRFL